MARTLKFTPVVIPQISSWVDEGLSALEIAEKIGCTLGTLRVRCSQLGISLRQGQQAPISAVMGSPMPVNRRQASEKSLARTRKLVVVDGCEDRLVVPMSQLAIQELRKRAASKGISGLMLAATLLQEIVQDNLYEAVLDDSDAITGFEPGEKQAFG
jgi:hypothetical protein